MRRARRLYSITGSYFFRGLRGCHGIVHSEYCFTFRWFLPYVYGRGDSGHCFKVISGRQFGPRLPDAHAHSPRTICSTKNVIPHRTGSDARYSERHQKESVSCGCDTEPTLILEADSSVVRRGRGRTFMLCTLRFAGVFPLCYGLGDSVYFLIVDTRRNAGLDHRCSHSPSELAGVKQNVQDLVLIRTPIEGV